MPSFKCPTCAEPREVRTDKNGRPYLHCDECGVQLFVRGKEGIRRMNALIEIGGLQDDPAQEEAPEEPLFEDE